MKSVDFKIRTEFFNPHAHKCDLCGTVWAHDPETIPEGSYDEAHTCPKPGCKATQFWCYDSQKRHSPEYCHNGARTIDLKEEVDVND